MASRSFFTTTVVAGSFFGLTRRRWLRGGKYWWRPSFMMSLPPRSRRRSGVSWGSGMMATGSVAAPAVREPEDVDDDLAVHLGRQEIAHRCENDDTRYSNGGSLPHSRSSMTMWSVRPGAPDH
ncbi:hypothetical protein D1007_08328 [Hordeum vulgare]|nr:hypothetical protein D1007_08328 [Hordeum vulgare]